MAQVAQETEVIKYEEVLNKIKKLADKIILIESDKQIPVLIIYRKEQNSLCEEFVEALQKGIDGKIDVVFLEGQDDVDVGLKNKKTPKKKTIDLA